MAGRMCPLTPLANGRRIRGGGAGYRGDFVTEYLVPLLYPAGLTQDIQLLLGGLVVLINGGIYTWILFRYRQLNKGG